jgi:hypothetical protein
MPIPKEPPGLIPGRTAQYWTRRAGVFLLLGIACSLAIPVGSAMPGSLRGAFFGGSFLLSMICCGIALRGFVGSYLASQNERRAGYSSTVISGGLTHGPALFFECPTRANSIRRGLGVTKASWESLMTTPDRSTLVPANRYRQGSARHPVRSCR